MTEREQLKAMLDRANIGYGLRHDYNPPGESVQVENDIEDSEEMITEFVFDASGKLVSVHSYHSERG